jgi:hypothetical protein
VQELEAFFRLDAVAMGKAVSRRRAHNRAGWAVQWGTVRMLGTFLASPSEVPASVAAFVAEQLGIDDPSCLKLYPERLPTQHEHAREIRDLLKVHDFEDGDLPLREYVAGRVWVSNEGPRALFDRAVTWLLRNRVLLPGITQLARLVGEVRTGEQVLIHSVVDTPVTPEFRRDLPGFLTVPDGAQVSALERWRRGAAGCLGPGAPGTSHHNAAGGRLCTADKLIVEVCQARARKSFSSSASLMGGASSSAVAMHWRMPLAMILKPARSRARETAAS